MKILLAEDNKCLAKTTAHHLNTAGGHEVIIALDGQIAIDLFKNSKDFDFVLSDLEMPKKGGLEVVGGIRKINPHVRIWLHSTDKELVRLYRLVQLLIGAERILNKDETLDALKEAGIC